MLMSVVLVLCGVPCQEAGVVFTRFVSCTSYAPACRPPVRYERGEKWRVLTGDDGRFFFFFSSHYIIDC